MNTWYYNKEVKVVGWYNPQMCSVWPKHLFVFGDNLIGKGDKGQACIRSCPNTFGIPTKRLPSMDRGAFFSDKQEELHAVDNRIETLIWTLISGDYEGVVFPKGGLGTGLAQMDIKSPKIYKFLNDFLYDSFGIKTLISGHYELTTSNSTLV